MANYLYPGKESEPSEHHENITRKSRLCTLGVDMLARAHQKVERILATHHSPCYAAQTRKTSLTGGCSVLYWMMPVDKNLLHAVWWLRCDGATLYPLASHSKPPMLKGY